MAAVAASVSFSAMANATDPSNPSGTVVDRFADVEVLRYTVPGFNELSLDQKKFIYYLTEAALAGRDILWDQNGKYNLKLRTFWRASIAIMPATVRIKSSWRLKNTSSRWNSATVPTIIIQPISSSRNSHVDGSSRRLTRLPRRNLLPWLS